MSGAVLKAIKDWCNGKFQHKGDYLTEVPEGYVTESELEAKKYLTQEDIPPAETGMTETKVRELVNGLFLDIMGGIRISQDAEGNWGYIIPKTDEVIPFDAGNSVKLYEWCIALNDGFVQSNEGKTFAYTYDSNRDSSVKYRLCLAINIPSLTKISIGHEVAYTTEEKIYINSELIYTKPKNAPIGNYTVELNLAKGLNNLEIIHDVDNTNTTYGKGSITIPSVVC